MRAMKILKNKISEKALEISKNEELTCDEKIDFLDGLIYETIIKYEELVKIYYEKGFNDGYESALSNIEKTIGKIEWQ